MLSKLLPRAVMQERFKLSPSKRHLTGFLRRSDMIRETLSTAS